MSYADEAVLIDPAASASEEAPASADQAAADTATGGDTVQDASLERSPTDGSGFQAVEQSSAIQHSAQKLDLPEQTQVLHVCLGSLPDMHAFCKAFYFLRSQPGRLTMEDMDTQVDCGILSEGPSLKMLQQVMLSAGMQTVLHSRSTCPVHGALGASVQAYHGGMHYLAMSQVTPRMKNLP